MKFIALQSEYSFQEVFYHLEDLVKDAANRGDGVVGVADTSNTFAHVKLEKLCDKHGVRPIFGARLAAMKAIERARSLRGSFSEQVNATLLARNPEGLKEIYSTVRKAYDRYYYMPRVLYDDIIELSENVIVIIDRIPSDSKIVPARADYYSISDKVQLPYFKDHKKLVFLPAIRYPRQEDADVYQAFAYAKGMDDRTYPLYIRSEQEYLADGIPAIAIENTEIIADSIEHIKLEKSENVRFKGNVDIRRECYRGAIKKGVDLDDPVYKARFEKELSLIEEKGFVDYFLVVSDMIRYAKNKMFVGPSRGSSAGSLVCYLLDITEIDPIEYNLIFERFIDTHRIDPPDIDTDFADHKRELVIKYLRNKYGEDNVAAIGTIATMKPKSAIGEFAKALMIPEYETNDVKDAIITRSGGDARANMCILDTLEGTDAGKKFIQKYPQMKIVAGIEGHARHYGKHAAGIIVSNNPLVNYCGVETRNDIIMMDKKDAEYLNILKIDALGLRTLSILEDTAELAGFDWRDFYTLNLDDPKVFDIFNQGRLSGIFQFEGKALSILTKQMGVNSFNDICAITSLARPGALNSGGAARYVKYHLGEDTPHYFDEDHKRITEETYGTVVYQEQMMMIAKELANMTWEDVADLRKAASKSLGDEFFGKYREKFIKGAMENKGYTEEQAAAIWKDISSSGSWSFNKSHAVSYGLISYWTAWAKAYYPLEFAAANLNHAKDDDHAVKILRDFVVNDGIEYVSIDPDHSIEKWSIKDGKLIGSLTGIKGIGLKKAQQIIKIRREGGKYPPAMAKMLLNPETPFDILFPAYHYFKKFYDDPVSYGLKKVHKIVECQEPREYVVIGKVVERDLRDRNDYQSVAKRGYEVEENQFYLNIYIEDDTDNIKTMIPPFKMDELKGHHLAEVLVPDKTWVLVKGTIRDNWRSLSIIAIAILDPESGGIKEVYK